MNVNARQAMMFKLSERFSPTPGPRYISEGDWSGELLRKSILLEIVKNAIEKNETLCVDLDGTHGYGTSFLEEVFGGLIREDKLTLNQLRKHLTFISDEEPYLISDINEYMEDAHNDK